MLKYLFMLIYVDICMFYFFVNFVFSFPVGRNDNNNIIIHHNVLKHTCAPIKPQRKDTPDILLELTTNTARLLHKVASDLR